MKISQTDGLPLTALDMSMNPAGCLRSRYRPQTYSYHPKPLSSHKTGRERQVRKQRRGKE